MGDADGRPLELRLPAGMHRVRVKGPNPTAAERDVTVRAGERITAKFSVSR